MVRLQTPSAGFQILRVLVLSFWTCSSLAHCGDYRLITCSGGIHWPSLQVFAENWDILTAAETFFILLGIAPCYLHLVSSITQNWQFTCYLWSDINMTFMWLQGFKNLDRSRVPTRSVSATGYTNAQCPMSIQIFLLAQICLLGPSFAGSQFSSLMTSIWGLILDSS